MTVPTTDVHERVLVLMPSTRDAERTASLLRDDGVSSLVCIDVASLCRELRVGAGVLLVTDDTVLGDSVGQLAESLRMQPSWSSIPIVVIAREAATQHVRKVASPALDGIIVIERPVRIHSLLSVLQSALRSRLHQYQIRDDMALRERQSATLQAQEERLRFALAAGGLGSWTLDLETMQLDASALCKQSFGRAADDPFTFEDFRASIHPDDRERANAAMAASIDTGADCDVEYRAVWPNGEEHWVMIRGRAPRDGQGRARYMTGVSLDIDERKRMHDALARHAAQLVDSDRKKDEFLATLAHELRNPLAPIRAGIAVVRGSTNPAIADRTLGIMDRQITHMVRLIDDLLDVSRITRGVLELRKEPVTLGTVLAAAVETSRAYVERGRHTLRITLPEPELTLHVDGTRIAQAVSNLLINASKYTAPGGQLELVAARRDAATVIQVHDNGIGIPADRLVDVFEMFNQVDPKREGAQGGLGIGLALVRKVVELHGGTVHATSPGSGRGSTFTIELPLGRAQTSTDPATVHTAARADARRILVVDDNVDAAELLSMMLELHGYVTLTAYDGASAIASVAAHTPDVVILDIGLPDRNGYEVARALREQPRAQPLGLIALTGWGTEEDKQRARDAGFDVHLTKPVDDQRLQAALADLQQLRSHGGAH